MAGSRVRDSLIRTIALAALSAIPIIVAPTVRAETARHALVITNQAYTGLIGRLKNPHEDGRVVAGALKNVGFDVVHVKDADKARFQAAIATFIATIAQAGNDAVAFFYYSGHGAAVAKYGDNYMIPVDAPVTHEAQLPFLALKLGDTIEGIAAAGARSSFVVVDACRNTPFASTTKAASKGLRAENERGGVMIAYATEPGNVALDNNAYARALAREIVRPGQPAVLMFRAVRRSVLKASANAQFPWTRDGLVEEFYFAGPGDDAASGASGRRSGPPEPGAKFSDCRVCPELVVVPKGRFEMGSPAEEAGRRANEGRPRVVEIPAPFAIATHEVSFAEWQACAAAGGCPRVPPDNGWGKGRQPVINVSWDDAQTYVAWLQRETGRAYRLPSEAEWEYAARAGTRTPFWQGATLTPGDANFDGRYGLDGQEVKAPSPDHYRRRPVAVARFAANAFGLKNVHGNVWEWVADCYRNPDEARSSRRVTMPGANGPSCHYRVLRGGSWYDEPARLRSAYRHSLRPATRVATVGFRVVRDLEKSTPPAAK